MNLPKFSVKNNIDAQHYVSVKLNTFGEKKANDFGAETYWGNCHVDGVEKMWFISENMHDNIIKAGFKPGDTFCVLKWKNGLKIGYNYLSADDIQIQNATPMKEGGQFVGDGPDNGQNTTPMKEQIEGNATLPPTDEQINEILEPPKDFQDPIQERIIRGMAGNQASNMLQYNENDSPQNIAELHFQVTKALHELEADWYRG